MQHKYSILEQEAKSDHASIVKLHAKVKELQQQNSRLSD